MLIPAKTSSPCSVKKSFWGSTGFYIAYKPDWIWIKLTDQLVQGEVGWNDRVFCSLLTLQRSHWKIDQLQAVKKTSVQTWVGVVRGLFSCSERLRESLLIRIYLWGKTSRISLDMFAGLARLSVFYYGSSSSVPWILIWWRSAQSPWLTGSHKDKTTRRTARLLWWIRTNWLPLTVESVIR